jgi:hypothetical protein
MHTKEPRDAIDDNCLARLSPRVTHRKLPSIFPQVCRLLKQAAFLRTTSFRFMRVNRCVWPAFLHSIHSLRGKAACVFSPWDPAPPPALVIRRSERGPCVCSAAVVQHIHAASGDRTLNETSHSVQKHKPRFVVCVTSRPAAAGNPPPPKTTTHDS